MVEIYWSMKTKQEVFFEFWAILGLGGLGCDLVPPWRFQTNDDELMMWLVSGDFTGRALNPMPYSIHPILSWCVFLNSILFFLPSLVFLWPGFRRCILSYLIFLDLAMEEEFQQLILQILVSFFFLHIDSFYFLSSFSMISAFAVSAEFPQDS